MVTTDSNTSNVVEQVLRQAVDAVVSIDENNRVTFFNAAAERLWGIAERDVLGKNVAMLVPAAMQANHDDFVNANRRTGIDKIVGKSRQVEIERADGTVVHASLSLSKVRVDGRILYTAFVKDETEAYEARERTTQILEQAVDGVVSIDENNNVTFFNKSAEKLWGLSADQVLGKNVKMLVPVEHQTNHDNYVDANRTTGIDKIVGTSRDVVVTRPDGSTVNASLSLSKVFVGDKITYTAFVKDDTEAFTAREKTRQILEQAIDAVVSIDGDNNVTFFNPAAERLWGYQREEVIGKNVKMLVPVEIQDNHDNLVNANRTTGVDKIVGTSREVPVYRADGGRKWGNLALSKVQVGGEISYTAFVKDVTDEVERREQFRLLSLVANETDNSVVITDNKGKIEYVNPGFTRLTGYTLDEVVGKTPGSVLQGPDTDKGTVERIRGRLRRAEPFYDEILNYNKEGEQYWISLAINPVFDEEGNVSKFISIQANIDSVKLSALEFSAKLDAIQRANLTVEFDLAGKVLAANQKLVDAMGLRSQEDLIGRPLDGFLVDPTVMKAVLDDLNRGQATTSEVAFTAGAGEVLWVNIAINPILDLGGRVVRAFGFGEDITPIRKAREKTEEILSESQRVMTALSNGDLRQRVNGEFEGDFASLQQSINDCCSRLSDLVTQIRTGSSSISDSAQTVAQGNQSLNSRTVEQASSLEETAASMEQMTATVQANADNAKEASRLATDARSRADTGGKVVKNAVDAMREIDDSSKRISDIIVVIDEIAFQTNLLALNAAVEAARAGDKGRGFSVVATEVRNLAQRSADAAREIKSLIKDSVRKVEEGTRLVNASGTTLGSIVEAVNQVTEIVSEIAGASEEQSEGINQINKAVSQMDSVTQQNAALVEEATAASEVLKNEATSLLEVIKFFEAESDAEAPAKKSGKKKNGARSKARSSNGVQNGRSYR